MNPSVLLFLLNNDLLVDVFTTFGAVATFGVVLSLFVESCDSLALRAGAVGVLCPSDRLLKTIASFCGQRIQVGVAVEVDGWQDIVVMVVVAVE